MKKLTTFLVAVLMTVALQAQDIKNENIKEFKWNLVYEAISMVESGGNPKAVSPSGKYVGYLQISTGMVTTCNQIAGYKKFTNKDRYSKEKSIEMFIMFQEKYNPEHNVEKAFRLWKPTFSRTLQRSK
jgi:hypothetical protein